MAHRTAAQRLREIAARQLASPATPTLIPVTCAAGEPGALETADPDYSIEDRPSWRERLDVRLDGRAQRAVIAIIGIVVLIAAWMWWSGRPTATVPLGEPGASTPAIAEVVVHVIGAVRIPGVVRLPVGARVGDAIDAAGGATKRKALGSVNLARVLVDGEQVIVGSASATGSADGRLSLSTATAAELESLPGIGPALAARIITWREANGPFTSVEALDEVSGIGPSILSQVRSLVTP